MSPASRHRAVVLDLDGTLVETAPDLCAALNHVLAREGLAPVAVEDVRHMVGEGARKLIERAFGRAGPAPAPEEVETRLPLFLDYYGANIAVHSAPFPGVPETLTALRAAGLRLGVCTNKPHGMTEALLAALDLAGHFDAVLGGDSLPVRKPHEGHLLAVLDALGAEAHEAVMVGDSPIDVACARAAGVAVIAVRYGYSAVAPEELGADALIGHFSELPEALGRLA